MAGQKVRNRKVNGDIFKEYLKNRGYSIKYVSEKTDITEKTIKRCLDDGAMSVGMVLNICYFLDEKASVLFGKDETEKWALSMSYLLDNENVE